MGFEQPEKVEAIIKVVRKGIDPAIKEAMEVCHEAAAKVQVLVGRAEKFKAQKAGLDREIEALQEDLRGTLHAGGDPGDINRKIRAKKDECGDLTTWAAELRDKAIPTAEKVLEEAQNQLWRVMIGVVRTLRPTWDQELNEVLAQAAALSASWTVAIRKIFSEYSIRPPTDPISFLQVDPKLTNFRCGSSYIPLGIAAVNT